MPGQQLQLTDHRSSDKAGLIRDILCAAGKAAAGDGKAVDQRVDQQRDTAQPQPSVTIPEQPRAQGAGSGPQEPEPMPLI